MNQLIHGNTVSTMHLPSITTHQPDQSRAAMCLFKTVPTTSLHLAITAMTILADRHPRCTMTTATGSPSMSSSASEETIVSNARTWASTASLHLSAMSLTTTPTCMNARVLRDTTADLRNTSTTKTERGTAPYQGDLYMNLRLSLQSLLLSV
jgi:hypothetical protein